MTENNGLNNKAEELDEDELGDIESRTALSAPASPAMYRTSYCPRCRMGRGVQSDNRCPVCGCSLAAEIGY